MSLQNSVFFIAEAGINHNGDLENAFRLIRMAKNAGCDAVKFQKREPEVCIPIEMRSVMRETPWGKLSYFDYKKKIEFGENEYNEINKYCKDLEITWSASAWDVQSLEFLDSFDLEFNKVASALTTNTEFLEQVADRGKLTYLSVGMCTYENIDAAVAIFKSKNCPLVLMHTISNYPAEERHLNLKMIETLKERYKLPVGYSGHESSD